MLSILKLPINMSMKKFLIICYLFVIIVLDFLFSYILFILITPEVLIYHIQTNIVAFMYLFLTSVSGNTIENFPVFFGH